MQPAKNGYGFLDNIKHMLRALRGRNYALFFMGQGFSLIGTWIQSVALGLVVYKLTGSAAMLGLVGFASQIFGFVLAPFAGVFSDRLNRRTVLLTTQALSAVQATLLAVLTLTGLIQVWEIVALAAFLGLINSFDIPTRQAFVVQMVHRREDLPNAIALNSFIFNGARLMGPVVAGVIIIPLFDRLINVRFGGEGACFVLNAVSYLAVIIALLSMRLPSWSPKPNQRNVLHDLREGFLYAFGFGPIRSILLMLGLISFVATPYSVLMPAIVEKVLFHGDRLTPIHLLSFGGHNIMLAYEAAYGLLVASAGTGALLGALFLASRKSVLGLSRALPIASTILGLGIAGFAMSHIIWLSMLLLVTTGLGFMVQMASSNTILQTIVDEDKRGRVMSFYTMSFMGTAPFGSLLAGWLAGYIGSPKTLVICGSLAVLAAAIFASRLPSLRQKMRPIYVKMGILSENAPTSREAADADIQNNGHNAQ